MFLSNKRALHVGDIEEVDLATSTGLHSIPAWFGLSGSMIGAIASGQANVIGLGRFSPLLNRLRINYPHRYSQIR